MNTDAVVFEKPGEIGVRNLSLRAAGEGDVILETLWSGISTGTEKMFWEGSMPPFPGMGYPLVPGYESVGRVVEAGSQSGRKPGDLVFIPGANCFEGAAGLFGASASKLVVPGERVVPLPANLREEAVLLALAATAYHAVQRSEKPVELVIGHGVLGRLIARILLAAGMSKPVVWEPSIARRRGGEGYDVIDQSQDKGGPYGCIIDASGALPAIDAAIGKLSRGGELVLAGFYRERVSFDFAPAFMREVSLAIAAEFTPHDVTAVLELVEAGKLNLTGLITHHASRHDAPAAYETAFQSPDCLKMVIDWRREA